MKKDLFIIQSYIPSDENKVYHQIYRIFSFGSKEKKIYFLDIINGSGIGIGLDNGGEDSIEKCIINFFNVCGLDNNESLKSKIGYFTFEEALKIKELQYENLKKYLKDEKIN